MLRRSGVGLHLAALLLLLLPVELCLAFYNPRWNNPDELSHAQYVLFLRDHQRLPDPYRESPKIQQDKHPPLTYALGALALRLSEGWFDRTRERAWALPGPYAVTLHPDRFDDGLRLFEGQAYVLRLLMVGFTLATAVWLLRCARLLLPAHPHLALGLTGGLLLIPQVALSGASLTPDTPLLCFSTACWFHLLRIRLDDSRALRREPWLCGLFLGLALLSKSSAVFLLPVVVWFLWRRWLWLLLTLLVALLVAGWWYARNVWRYGDPFQMQTQFETFAVMARFSPMGGPEWESLVRGLADSFFGFWHLEIQIAAPFLLLLQGLAVATGLGLLLLLRAAVRAELPVTLRAVLVPAVLAAAALLGLVVVGNLRFPSPQGRYLHPALAPLLALCAGGFMALWRVRGDVAWAWAIPPAMAALTVGSFFPLVVAREALERGRAEGHGGVLFYQDCGHPAGHPYRTRGFDLPDQNQLGRRTPWRTLDVDPEAVEYRFPIAAPRDDLQVRVLYHNPDPSVPPRTEAAGRAPYSAQRLLAGGVVLHEHIDLTPTPCELRYPLPAAAFSDGGLRLRFERVAGTVAAVAELWIEVRDHAEPGPFARHEAEALPPAAAGGVVLGAPVASGGYLLLSPRDGEFRWPITLTEPGRWHVRARVRLSRLLVEPAGVRALRLREERKPGVPALIAGDAQAPGLTRHAGDDGFWLLDAPDLAAAFALDAFPSDRCLELDWIELRR